MNLLSRFVVIVIIILLPAISNAQDPVTWHFAAKKINNDAYQVMFTANLQPGWHIYSQNTPSGGPTPTSIIFRLNPLLNVQGKIKEVGKLEDYYEHVFETNVKQYSNSVTFIQEVRKKVPARTKLTGYIEFMTCNEEMCLPSEKTAFSIDIQ